MFDFGAAHRTEGDRDGINDKGLVTHDRKTKKDAYYFYRANWNSEPMVYIAGKRAERRSRETTDVTVFSNSGAVTLYVNGKKAGTAQPDNTMVCTFTGVKLAEGENIIEAVAGNKKHPLTDRCVWNLSPQL